MASIRAFVALVDEGRAQGWSSLDDISRRDFPAPQRDTGVRGWPQLLPHLSHVLCAGSHSPPQPTLSSLALFVLTMLTFFQFFKYISFLTSKPANTIFSAWNSLPLPLCRPSSSLSFRSVLKHPFLQEALLDPVVVLICPA